MCSSQHPERPRVVPHSAGHGHVGPNSVHQDCVPLPAASRGLGALDTEGLRCLGAACNPGSSLPLPRCSRTWIKRRRVICGGTCFLHVSWTAFPNRALFHSSLGPHHPSLGPHQVWRGTAFPRVGPQQPERARRELESFNKHIQALSRGLWILRNERYDCHLVE